MFLLKLWLNNFTTIGGAACLMGSVWAEEAPATLPPPPQEGLRRVAEPRFLP